MKTKERTIEMTERQGRAISAITVDYIFGTKGCTTKAEAVRRIARHTRTKADAEYVFNKLVKTRRR